MSLEPEQKNFLESWEEILVRMLSGLEFLVLQKARGKEENQDLNSFVLHVGELSDFLK